MIFPVPLTVQFDELNTTFPSHSVIFTRLEAPIIEVFAPRAFFVPHKINDSDSVIEFDCPQIESVHSPLTVFVVPFASFVATNSLSSIFQVTSV